MLNETIEKLKANDQEHVIKRLLSKNLTDDQKNALIRDVQAVDFDSINTDHVQKRGAFSKMPVITLEEISQKREIFQAEGEKILKSGKVAAFFLDF